MQKHFTIQHAVNLDESNVFDMHQSNGGDSQYRSSENPIRINKESIGLMTLITESESLSSHPYLLIIRVKEGMKFHI